jgi:hypothetical protein
MKKNFTDIGITLDEEITKRTSDRIGEYRPTVQAF